MMGETMREYVVVWTVRGEEPEVEYLMVDDLGELAVCDHLSGAYVFSSVENAMDAVQENWRIDNDTTITTLKDGCLYEKNGGRVEVMPLVKALAMMVTGD